MDTDGNIPSQPWHPLTFGSVAAFGFATFSRLLAVAFVVSLLLAASVVFCFYLAWEPALRQAIAHLPDDGAIRNGQLEWHGPSPARLAEGNFLAIVVDLSHTGELGHASDLQWEFGEKEIRVRSLLGYVGIAYPMRLQIQFNRRELEPWWGAWHPTVAAGIGTTVLFGLLIGWCVLGAFFALPAQLIAFYANRQLTLFGAWRLGVASLFPGALLMCAAIFAYGFQQLNLIQLIAAWVLHVILGLLYLLVSPFCLIREPGSSVASSKSRNPFQDNPNARKPKTP